MAMAALGTPTAETRAAAYVPGPAPGAGTQVAQKSSDDAAAAVEGGAAATPSATPSATSGATSGAAPGPASPASAEEPLRGDGIQWTLAPWRVGGTLAVDLRALREPDGRHQRAGLMLGDIDLASHVWQPWFVQVRLGAGWVASATQGSEADQRGHNVAFTGRAALTVFPVSRFPFELRADVSDSRSNGLNLGSDYRTRRLALSQGWRPVVGATSVQLNVDRSRIESAGLADTLSTYAATFQTLQGKHQWELSANGSRHERSDSDETTRITTFNGRHGFHPSAALQVETFANWNEVQLTGNGIDTGSDVRQISTLATWRLPRGALVAGSARWVEAVSLGGEAAAPLQAVNATLGGSMPLSADWRIGLSGSANELRTAAGGVAESYGAQGSLNWAPPGHNLLGWRWSPTAALSGGVAHDSSRGDRKTAGAQFSQALTREVALAPTSLVSFGLTQGLATLRESGSARAANAVAHGASVGWQRAEPDGAQSFGALSYSEARTLGTNTGRFEIVNLQWNQRTQLTRHASWSVHLTAQASRNESSEVDAFSGERREQQGGWQPYYSAGASLEHQRAFDIPRLRATVLFSAQSQPLVRRAAGDLDAERDRFNASLEGRLDWSIGRLEARLAARVARVEDRTVAALQARAQRRF
ncbi:MAG: hypothetical protein JNL30_17265 [Rubrivivax sp.]|nr:hypothetical protein [Rubrivivax sp.]